MIEHPPPEFLTGIPLESLCSARPSPVGLGDQRAELPV